MSEAEQNPEAQQDQAQTDAAAQQAPNRYVAIGDSFSEGVGDWDEQSPNGVRGWPDRVAEQLLETGQWSYANLAVRGKKVNQVLAEQVPAALELKPTLVTCYAGGNDILRPSVDVDELVARYVEGMKRFADVGAKVFLFTAFDTGRSKIFAATRGRAAIYNELLREAAAEHGFGLVDYWRMKEFQDWRLWDEDRLHMAPAGHAHMAAKVLQALEQGQEPGLPLEGQAPVLSGRAALAANVEWAQKHLAPWVGRRLRGVSSGDTLQPRFPAYVTHLSS